MRNAEGRNYGCPECGVWFFTSAAVHLHLDKKHSSRGESKNGNGTKEIPENAQGRPSCYGCTHCTQYFYSECLAVDHMKTHTERDGWESDSEMRSENNEQTSHDTSENNGAESEEGHTERDGVNGGTENKGSAVIGDEHKENNGAETEENRVCGSMETEEIEYVEVRKLRKLEYVVVRTLRKIGYVETEVQKQRKMDYVEVRKIMELKLREKMT